MSVWLERLHQTVPIPAIDNRPSGYEYALMSQLAYMAIESNADLLTSCPKELRDLHWTILKECSEKSEGGYSGIILRNEQRKQLVLAHRGTLLDKNRKFKSFQTMWEDINGIYRQKITPQKEAVHKYTREVMKLLKQSEYKDYHVSFTGHSLGGLLAELSVFYVHNEIRVSEYIHVNAVTFESPGSQDVIEELQSNKTSGRVSLEDLDIVGYVTYPNVINTFNRHIGTLYSINVDIGIQPEKSFFRRWFIPGNPLEYTMKTHTIDNIVKWFESLESNSESKRLLMTDWPLGLQYRKLFDNVLISTGGIYTVNENEDNEFMIQFKAHFVPNEDLGRWYVLSLTQLCKHTKDILEHLDTYEFVNKRDNVSTNPSVIMTELKDCCTFQRGTVSDGSFLIINEVKFRDLNNKLADENVQSRSYDVAHQFRYAFTKFVFENVQHQPSVLPTKWWPGMKTTIQRVVDRKVDGKQIIETMKELLDRVKDGRNDETVLLRKLVLSGMGGTGKTTTAQFFAIKYQQDYKFIIWVDCGEHNLEKSLRELSTSLKHKHTSSTRMDTVVFSIYESIKSVKCLLVLDNAEDYESVKYWLPPQDAPHHCLITSRSRYWGNENELGEIQSFPIGVFSFEDAQAFLKGALKNTTENERLELSIAMDRLPLALQIAVATINRQKYSISNYLQKIEVMLQKLLTKKIDSYPLSLQKSLGVTISTVVDNEECGKVAFEILSILCFLAPENITKDLIITILEFENVELENIDEEMLLIHDTSITNCSDNGELFSIHRLLQDVLRITLPDMDPKIILKKILTVMWSVYFENTEESENLRGKIGINKYGYRNHVWRVWEHAIKDEALTKEFEVFFLDVIQNGIHDIFRSIKFLKSLLPHLDKYYGFGSDIACQIRDAVASVLFVDERYEEYCKFCEVASNVFSSFNPSSRSGEPPLRIEAMIINANRRLMAATFNLGIGEEKQGKYTKAILLYQKIVQNEKYWVNKFLQNPNRMKGLKIENDEIISGPTTLFADYFPLILQLKSKIVSLLVISNDLDKALEYILKLEENMKEYNSWKNSADFITLAGLQLLRAFGKSENLKTELGRSNRIWALLRYLWDGFVLWSRESDVWQQISQWTWIDAEYAHKIALSLIESEDYEEAVSVYKMQCEIQSRLACLPVESEFNFQEVETWGFVVINKLESLKRESEAKCVQMYLNRTNKIFNAEELLEIIETDVSTGDTIMETENESVRLEFRLESCSSEPVTFSGLNVDGKISTSALKTIHLISVQLYKCELIWALNECVQLENLILDDVDIHGCCDKRVYLPNLKVFVIELFNTEKTWWREDTIKCESEVDIFWLIKMHSFFYKAVENKDWNLNDLKSLRLHRYKIAIPDKIEMEINELSESCFEYLFRAGETVELLEVLDPRPTKLLLEYCQTSLNSVIQFGENIKELILYSVTLTDVKTEIDLCDMLLNHLPNLEKLVVHNLEETPMCMMMCKFSSKLKYLTLSSITVVLYPATTNDESNENDICPKFELLTHLEVSQVFFKDETETELNQLLLKHFPNLETLIASSTRKRQHKVTELSLDVSILPRSLTKLRIKSVKLIHSSRETTMLNLTNISLEDISLSPYNDSELVKLFGINCEDVFLAGPKIELSDVRRLIRNSQSISSINITGINWESAGREVIDWIESLGIKKFEPDFSIERKQGMWKGECMTGFTQVRNKTFDQML